LTIKSIVHYIKTFVESHDSVPTEAGFLVMPLFCASLQAYILCRTSVSVHLLIRLGLTLLHAHAAFESKGLSHCDIKPSNIMLDRNENYTLIDLGSVVELGKPSELFFSTLYLHLQILKCKIVQSYTGGYGRQADMSSVTSDYDFQCILTTLSQFAILEYQVSDHIVPLPLENDTSGLLNACNGWVKKNGEAKYMAMRQFAIDNGWKSELDKFDSWIEI
jgi:serine/threonine protein kinase